MNWILTDASGWWQSNEEEHLRDSTYWSKKAEGQWQAQTCLLFLPIVSAAQRWMRRLQTPINSSPFWQGQTEDVGSVRDAATFQWSSSLSSRTTTKCWSYYCSSSVERRKNPKSHWLRRSNREMSRSLDRFHKSRKEREREARSLVQCLPRTKISTWSMFHQASISFLMREWQRREATVSGVFSALLRVSWHEKFLLHGDVWWKCWQLKGLSGEIVLESSEMLSLWKGCQTSEECTAFKAVSKIRFDESLCSHLSYPSILTSDASTYAIISLHSRLRLYIYIYTRNESVKLNKNSIIIKQRKRWSR